MNDNILRDNPLYHGYHEVQQSYRGGTGVYLGGAPTAICEGRLTLVSGQPVTTADVASASTIYFSPYNGNRIALYDGISAWRVLPFAETAIVLTGLSSVSNYDLFAYNQNGTLAFDPPLVWANTTTRATALQLQNGVLVKSTDTTRRYIGSFSATSNTSTSDSGTPSGSTTGRLLFNAQNRVLRAIQGISTTTYSTSSTSNQSPDTNNLVTVFFVGLDDQPVRVSWQLTAYVSSTGYVGRIGLASSAGGALLSPSYRVVNLTTMHTECGEQVFFSPEGINRIYVTYNVSNVAETLTVYTAYSPSTINAYLWC